MPDGMWDVYDCDGKIPLDNDLTWIENVLSADESRYGVFTTEELALAALNHPDTPPPPGWNEPEGKPECTCDPIYNGLHNSDCPASEAKPACDCGKIEHGRHHTLCPASGVRHSEKESKPATEAPLAVLGLRTAHDVVNQVSFAKTADEARKIIIDHAVATVDAYAKYLGMTTANPIAHRIFMDAIKENGPCSNGSHSEATSTTGKSSSPASVPSSSRTSSVAASPGLRAAGEVADELWRSNRGDYETIITLDRIATLEWASVELQRRCIHTPGKIMDQLISELRGNP